MSDQADRVHVVRQWVEKAEEDLVTAEHSLTLQERCPFATVCFHAQQCVEKYIKALLAYQSIDFPKVHDIGELVELLPSDLKPPLTIAQQEELTDHATVSRYPGDREPLSRANAEEAVGLARTVRGAVRTHLPKEVLD